MLIEQQKQQFNALNEWFQSSLGLSIAHEFTRQLHPIFDCLKGATLLQLGNCAENPWLDTLDFKSKWIAAPFNIEKKVNVICSLNQIPLNRNSIDCVLAPLTIEPFSNYLNIVDEIDRILKPMGYVVFLSINPWSLWGWAMKWRLVHCFSDHSVKMHTPFHLNRVMTQRGYRQCSLNHFYYIPPVTNQALLKKLVFFNEVGKMLWPFPSGFYCYIAQKYEYITPVLTEQALVREAAMDYEPSLQPSAMRYRQSD